METKEFNYYGYCADNKFFYIPETEEIFSSMNEIRKKYGQSVAKKMWKNKEIWIVSNRGKELNTKEYD